ncbi:MAG: hypothetical protein A3J28_01165 [Acidobacteria bacterium RIFCSPLOWO2_12_FULL_60_22]|nr:MAG: hypothetical protein A3J28_01165 [Acidobacteria bacterium RIFCSPLOWO2_12_FULL_60_22]
MGEVSLTIRGYQGLVISLDPAEVRGEGSAARPVLYLPLKVQITSIPGQKGPVSYTLLRLAGTLGISPNDEIAAFELPPLADVSCPRGYDLHHGVNVPLGHAVIRRLEDVRDGKDAQLSIRFSALVWYPPDSSFVNVASPGPLQLTVPRSTWADNVLSQWGLSLVKIVEIKFPANQAGENFRAAYARVEAAEKLYANGLWKQTLAELYSAFEDLAKSLGFARPDQQFFVSLLAEFPSAKKEKAKLALAYLCDFYHLGRHEPEKESQPNNLPFILRRDARLGLTLAHAFFEYLTPEQ